MSYFGGPGPHVFLGAPLTDPTEKKFLARLVRDLRERGISALVLVNLQVGAGARQVDFLIITPNRVVQCEVKGLNNPVTGGPNGRWELVFRDGSRRPFWGEGNPYRQAQETTLCLSDTIRTATGQIDVPKIPNGRYYAAVDTVVCAFPSLPAGSKLESHRYVSVVGYEELLDRLDTEGPHLPWSKENWGELIRHLNLYREDEVSDEALSHQARSALLGDYRRRFLSMYAAGLPPLVATKVAIDDAPEVQPLPDLSRVLRDGEAVIALGASGAGKSHLARHEAVRLAGEGHLPIWIDAHSYEGSVRTLLARAIAPFATRTPTELIRAAHEEGRVVAVFVDGLNECPKPLREELLKGLAALRLKFESSVLLTTQLEPVLPEGLQGLRLHLLPPDEQERQELLRTYGAPDLEETEAFETPLELSIAADCAAELGEERTRGALFDTYIRRRAEREPVRAGLRLLAWHLHEGLRGSLPAQDALRLLQRDGLSPADAEEVLASRLLVLRPRLVSFVHEEFARFLAAEQLAMSAADTAALIEALGEPRNAGLREDALALEQDRERLERSLEDLADPNLLFAAVRGALGAAGQQAGEAVLARVLDLAIEQTRQGNATLHTTGDLIAGDWWELRREWSPGELAALEVTGRLLARGSLVDPVAHLLSRTDEICLAAAHDLQQQGNKMAISHVVSATYGVLANETSKALPASLIVRACEEHRRGGWSSGIPTNGVAAKLLRSADSQRWGPLYAFAVLFDPEDAEELALVPDVLKAAWQAQGYHLRLQVLQMVERTAWIVEGDVRGRIEEALKSLDSNHLMLNSALAEALAAFDLIDSGRTVEEVQKEIREGIAHSDEQIAQSLARGAVSSQFEDEQIVGPYHRAIAELDPEEWETLHRLAANASEMGDLTTDWIVKELAAKADPERPDIRAVFERFARSPDPSSWFAGQHGTSTYVQAIRACARFRTQPPMEQRGSPELRAWAVVGELVFWMERETLGLDVGSSREQALWDLLLDELRPAAADVFYALHQGEMIIVEAAERVHDRLVARHPKQVLGLLSWSLLHRDQLQSAQRFVRGVDRDRYLVGTLGEIGNASTTDLLRRYANDPDISETVSKAIKSIDQRGGA